MQRDPTPPGSFDAHIQQTPFNSSPLKSHPTPFTGGSYGATGVPSHGPSTSFGGYPGQEFGGPLAQPPFTSFGRGHTPAASWSGPDGAYTTPAFTQPPRDVHTDQTYTSPEMARAGPSFGPGAFAGMGPIPLAGPSTGFDAPHRAERFSMPVSDEELRTTAEIINGTRTFVVPLGSLSGPAAFDFLDGPFVGFPMPHPQPEQDPWDKSASIHTLYSELPKESTPPMSTPRREKEADAASEVSRAPTVPPKDTPRVSPKTVPVPLQETPKAAPHAEEKRETPKPAAQEKTPRMADLHLPADPSITPAIRLQAPTTTDPTAVTAASKSNSTPVTESTARSASNSSVEQKWDATPRESFSTAQPQLPAYQSQPSSPVKTPEAQFFPPEKRGGSSSSPKPSSPKKTGTGPNGTHSTPEKARKQKHPEKHKEKRHSGDNKKATSTAPSFSTTHTPRAFEVMSPETMTTNISRELKPPDHVTERLYAWAREKSELDFVEALERMSGGDEVRLPFSHFRGYLP